MLPDALLRRARLTTLCAVAAVATLAGCATPDDGYSTGADRPPCTYPCQQPTVVTPRKTVVSATPKVRPKS